MMAKNARILFFLLFDFGCFNAAYLLSYLASASFGADAMPAGEAVKAYFALYPAGFLLLMLVKLLAMYVFSVYRIWFEYAGAQDFRRVLLALVTGTFASVTAAALIKIDAALVPGIILFSLLFDLIFVFSVRILYLQRAAVFRSGAGVDEEGQSIRHRYAPPKRGARRVMVVGTGRAAADLIAEMHASEMLGKKPEIIVDDEKGHEGDTLLGVEVVAGRSEIRLRARRQSIDEIMLAKPAASRKRTAALIRECVKTRCKISMLPTSGRNVLDAAAPPAALKDLRMPTVSDLLGRDLPRAPHREIDEYFKTRVVLVTGGAGAFGSELCRRIIKYRPRRLVALDTDEDGLAALSAEFEAFHAAETEFRVVVASVRDAAMMRRAFGAFRPHIVFHAAELKQIPLAQTNPRETFLTNVLGLKTACDLADEFAAEKFILCSTIRAAEPISVAAQCKRTAELYVAEKNEKSRTAYSTARFPNLIEGRGNVIALFEKQIERGGPLTVMDKGLVRYFMSAREAALLTAWAASRALGGEVFELGPGEPFGILELAEAMIRLSGKLPGEDIDIAITQLRTGERLFEAAPEEQTRIAMPATERIFVTEEQGELRLPHWSQLWCHDADHLDDAAVMELLRMIFPTYKIKSAGVTTRGVKIENEP